MAEVLSTGGGKTWAIIIISSPTGQACLAATGEGWRTLPAAGLPDGPQA